MKKSGMLKCVVRILLCKRLQLILPSFKPQRDAISFGKVVQHEMHLLVISLISSSKMYHLSSITSGLVGVGDLPPEFSLQNS